MEFVKRHGFLLGLVGGVVAIGLAVGLYVQFAHRSESGALLRQLNASDRRARNLLTGRLYTQAAVDQMRERVELVASRHQAILDWIADAGRRRKPLVEDMFPRTADFNKFHQFKALYRDRVLEFLDDLGAVSPTVAADATEAEIAARREKILEATMLASPDSFIMPAWVDRPGPPTLEDCRIAQEDYWLMQDIVRVIARMNEDYVRDREASVENAAVKELVQIRTGASEASLEGGGAVRGGRYRVAGRRRGASPDEEPRAQTLTGRGSEEGFYLVLPWQLTTVVQSNLSGELVRRLKDTESFLTVESWSVTSLTKASQPSTQGLLVANRLDYGKAGVVRLVVVGESLLFQLEGGRVTTKTGVLATQPAGGRPETGPPPGYMEQEY